MQYVDHIYGMVGGFYYPVLKYFTWYIMNLVTYYLLPIELIVGTLLYVDYVHVKT